MVNILCYGDSNTYGFDPDTKGRFDKEIRWTGVLQNLLGKDYNVIGEGLNGRTTVFDDPVDDWKNGLNYVRGIVCTHRPVDVFVIMLGTNDLKTCFGADVDSIRAGLEAVVDSALETLEKKQGFRPKCLIVSPAPLTNVSEGDFAGSFDEESVNKSRMLAAAFETLSRDKGVYFLDCGEATMPSATDGVHLDSKGHKLLGTAIGYKLLRDIC